MMKLGVYLNAQHPAGDDPTRRFAETLEQVRLIRSLGFDSIWGGEHHATPGFHYFPLLPMLQRLAAEAEGLWLGTNLMLLPYFLPRYDDQGRMINEGHALATAAGIPCLLRRTYRNPTQPAVAPDDDFVSYFECGDADVPTFHQVCAALRDVARNPEWRFVREGPTWHGRRVSSWEELFT